MVVPQGSKRGQGLHLAQGPHPGPHMWTVVPLPSLEQLQDVKVPHQRDLQKDVQRELQ